MLKRITHAPEIVPDIQNVLEESIRSFAENGYTFPAKAGDTSSPSSGCGEAAVPKPFTVPQPVRRKLCSLEDVSNIYFTTIGRAASHIAPTLCLHPGHKEWNPMTVITHDHDDTGTPFVRCITLSLPAYEKNRVGGLSSHSDIAKKFEGAVGEDEELAVVFVLPPIKLAEYFLEAAVVEGEKEFRWRFPGGVEGEEELNAEILETYMGDSSCDQRDAGDSLGEKYWEKYRQEWEARKRTKDPQFEGELLRDLLSQRIWTKMVSIDATFCAISCGTKERIGVRHRESNSLFFSDIIEPSAEGYGAIHVALYCAIIKDAMGRAYSEEEDSDEDKMMVDDTNSNPSVRSQSENEQEDEAFNQ
ncbi:hypothetical protein CVT24_001383, partial [Panaeolus cyanescens]